MNIYLRLKPPSKEEEICKYQIIDQLLKIQTTKKNKEELNTSFEANYIFNISDDQNKVFNTIAVPALSNFYAYKNCLIMAYGETGSGKTYTLLGGSIIIR